MSLTLDIGATGMLAQQLNVNVISNNIANMTTAGYKRRRAEFQDLLYQTKIRPGSTTAEGGEKVPTGIQLGLGVKAGSVYSIAEQGALSQTSNQLDMAIVGEGYFQIALPSGETGYTRDGSFQLNESGQIVNAQGYTLEPSVSVPADAISITINESGEVFVKLEGQASLSNVGQIQIARFPNRAGLEAVGNNLLLETEASGTPVLGTPAASGYGLIRQEFIESSNVDPVQEVTALIQAQRAYEMNSKIIKAGDEMLSTINQIK